jgi:hypothetical protein
VVPKGYKAAAQSEIFVLEWLASDDGSEPFTATWTQEVSFWAGRAGKIERQTFFFNHLTDLMYTDSAHMDMY